MPPEVLPAGKNVSGGGYRFVHIPGNDEASLGKLEGVRRIHNQYAGELGGLSQIAKRLNPNGIEPPQPDHPRRKSSRGWCAASVREIMEQPSTWARRDGAVRLRASGTGATSPRH